MAEEQNSNIYNDQTLDDKNSLTAYLDNIYTNINPFPYARPQLKEVTFWKFSGVKTAIFVMQAIGAAILSAIRTGGLFLIIELLLIIKFGLPDYVGNVFGYVSMFAALFTFEGFLLAKGISEGEKSNDLNESNIALWISFIVTVGAGIFSGLGIVKIGSDVEYWIDLLLAIASAVGASGMTYFGSQNIGFAFKKFNDKKDELDNIYRKQCEDYNILLATWKSEGAEEYNKSRYNNRRKDSFYNFQNGISKNQKIEIPVQNPFIVEQKIPKNEK